MSKVRWTRPEDAGPEDRGCWRSHEGRFEIDPNYRSTIYPDSYTVTDYVGDYVDHTDVHGRRLRVSRARRCETVRECKTWAERRVE